MVPESNETKRNRLRGGEDVIGFGVTERFGVWWRLVSRNGAGIRQRSGTRLVRKRWYAAWEKRHTLCFFWHLELIFSLKFMTVPNPKGCKSDGDNRDQKYVQPLGNKQYPQSQDAREPTLSPSTGPSDCARGMAQSIEESFMKITEPPDQRDQLHRLVG